MKSRKVHIRKRNEFIPEIKTNSAEMNEKASTVITCNSGRFDIVRSDALLNEKH